jgi:hypothetical protein
LSGGGREKTGNNFLKHFASRIFIFVDVQTLCQKHANNTPGGPGGASWHIFGVSCGAVVEHQTI